MELQNDKEGVRWRGDVKVFYSLLKHALRVHPTHIHVYGVFMANTIT